MAIAVKKLLQTGVVKSSRKYIPNVKVKPTKPRAFGAPRTKEEQKEINKLLAKSKVLRAKLKGYGRSDKYGPQRRVVRQELKDLDIKLGNI